MKKPKNKKSRNAIISILFLVSLITVIFLLNKQKQNISKNPPPASESASSEEIKINKSLFKPEVLFDDTPVAYKTKEIPKNWQVYESEFFNVYFPSNRKVYDQAFGSASNHSFSLCPVGSCQDSEMSIAEWTVNKSAETIILEEQNNLSQTYGSENYKITVLTDFSVNGYKGIAYKTKVLTFPKIMNFSKSDMDKYNKTEVFDAFIKAGNKVFHLYFIANNPIHAQIVGSFSTKK